MKQEIRDAILQHQAWLVKLHESLPTRSPDSAPVSQVRELPDEMTLEHAKIRYSHWLWSTPSGSFCWKPRLPHSHPCPRTWPASDDDWREICAFLRSLRWKTGNEYSFSFCELAAVFHASGYRIHSDVQLLTFRELTNLIRKAIQLLSKDPAADAVPGTFNSTRPRSCGRVLPQGCLDHAIPFVTEEGYLLIARLLARGAGRTLESWEIPVCDF